MMDNPDRHQRHSIRLKDYDYTTCGAYFVTIVTWQRECLFGEILGGEMCMKPAGEIAQQEWFKTAELRSNVKLFPDEFVVMPNHVHGVIWIVGGGVDGPRVGAQRRCAPTENVPARGLGAIVRGYKSAVTYRLNAVLDSRGASVWQRNYYEHIIRNEAELTRIQAYIRSNPVQWETDKENTRK